MIATIETFSTQEGLKICRSLKEQLLNAVSAEIRGPHYSSKELILTDEDDEEVILKGCFSAGYGGEGPRGTYTILKELGFNVSLEFIQQNENFKIKK